jgi:hypothetical protein
MVLRAASNERPSACVHGKLWVEVFRAGIVIYPPVSEARSSSTAWRSFSPGEARRGRAAAHLERPTLDDPGGLELPKPLRDQRRGT